MTKKIVFELEEYEVEALRSFFAKISKDNEESMGITTQESLVAEEFFNRLGG